MGCERCAFYRNTGIGVKGRKIKKPKYLFLFDDNVLGDCVSRCALSRVIKIQISHTLSCSLQPIMIVDLDEVMKDCVCMYACLQ